jgi:hypothetical protein
LGWVVVVVGCVVVVGFGRVVVVRGGRVVVVRGAVVAGAGTGDAGPARAVGGVPAVAGGRGWVAPPALGEDPAGATTPRRGTTVIGATVAATVVVGAPEVTVGALSGVRTWVASEANA